MVDGITSDWPLYSRDCSILSGSLAESLVESRHVNVLDNQTRRSSLQNDSSLNVDRTNLLQDCSQAGVAEVVPVLSNISLTNTVRNPDQLRPRCEKEYGNDARSFSSQTPMDRVPSVASQLTTDSPIIEAIDLQVAELTTNTAGTLSSQALLPTQRQSVLHQSIDLRTTHENATVSSSSSWKNQLVTSHPQDPMVWIHVSHHHHELRIMLFHRLRFHLVEQAL